MNRDNVQWSFFSNFAHVLFCLAENPNARQREVADRVGVTERTAARLIAQLAESGVLVCVREGRRNSYYIDTDRHLRHPVEDHCTVGELLAMILSPARMHNLQRQLADHRRLAGAATRNHPATGEAP